MRLATAADVPALVAMAARFHAASAPAWTFNPQSAETLFSNFIESPDGYVAIDQGFIAGVLSAHPLSPEWIIASEILWWSEGKSGARLLRGFRAWAKANDANEIRWSCPPDKCRVRRVFERSATLDEVIYSEKCHVL